MAGNYQQGAPEEDLLIPPDNFAMVEPGIYRAGFPGKKNFPFIKTLGLRTILYLCPEEYPEANLAFLTASHVQLLQYGVAGNKEPFLEIPHDIISSALVQILDVRNHPLLIHCNKGKHRTGCMVGVLRRVLGWSLTAVFEEYRIFSQPKERFMDQQFIECWNYTLAPPHSHLHATDPKRIDGGSDDVGDSSPGPTDEVSLRDLCVDHQAHLVNPEANEPLVRSRDKEKEARNAAAAAAAARADPPATTTHASLHHTLSDKDVGATHPAPAAANPRLSHHHHAHSQPNLGSIFASTR